MKYGIFVSFFLRLILVMLVGMIYLPAAKLTSLGVDPDWSELDTYQSTISRSEFLTLLNQVYAADGAYKETFGVYDDHVQVVKRFHEKGTYKLLFRKAGVEAEGLEGMRSWRKRSEFNRVPREKVLQGLKIALDPGHLGGRFAELEKRWFRVNGGDIPVAEGDLTLRVALMLREDLSALGAEVSLIRSDDNPLTTETPQSLRPVATRVLGEKRKASGRTDLIMDDELDSFSKLLFYRVGEIQARADMVNETIKPDLVLCLHFDAAPWPDKTDLSLVDKNHFHVLVNGAYSQDELQYDDVRFEMFLRLLQRIHGEEIQIAESVQERMQLENWLPPFRYSGKNAINLNGNPYLWARNLMANRKYICPVIYLEPYCMNDRDVYQRVQEGDYKGKKNIGGRLCKSIYREYADGVISGLLEYYGGSEAR